MNNSFLLTSESPKYSQVPDIKIALKPHQLASLYKMIQLDRDYKFIYQTTESQYTEINTNIAILGDLPSYGKTLTFLSLISALKDVRCQWCPNIQTTGLYGTNVEFGFNYGYAIHSPNSTIDCIQTSLIVVPNNLITHWQEHLQKFTNLSFEIISNKNIHEIIVQEYDVILCPASIYNVFIDYYTDYCWNRVAFDEADSIVIPNTRAVKTRFVWLITATFDNIKLRRNKGFLKDLFINTRINANLDYILIKCCMEFVKQSFYMIEPNIVYVPCLTPRFVNAIRNFIDNTTLGYINSGDMRNAILSLGGNIDNDNNIINLVTKNIQNEILTIRSKIALTQNLDLSDAEKIAKITEYNQKLQRLHDRKHSLEESISQAFQSNCVICYDTLTFPTITPCCNNLFCAGCLLDWINRRNIAICPLCRATFNPQDLRSISNEPAQRPVEQPREEKSKEETVIKIITEKGKGRFLLFSDNYTTLTQLYDKLLNLKIHVNILSNISNNKTQKILQEYRNNNYSVLILNTKYNGAGIEIPETTDVILYYQMEASLEAQAIARAQRPQRTTQLTVWKLKYEHEYSTF